MAFRRTIVQTNYDSVLNPSGSGQPAKLTIRLKVALLPRDPAVPGNAGGPQHPTHLAGSLAQVHHGPMLDANSQPVACRSWLISEWNAFKIRFKKVVELAWNNQMIMLPPDTAAGDGGLNDSGFLQLVYSPIIAAHVECALDIELMPTVAGSHAQIEVVHLEQPDLDFRAWMHRIPDDSVDITIRHKEKWPDTALYQFVAAHEVGHWLRDLTAKHFEHVDAGQPGNAQYGHVLGKRMAMMGSGTLFTEHEAQPWLGRIRRHTGALYGWTPIHKIHFKHVEHQITERQRQLATAVHS
jgi:hypothetical protein